MLTITIPGTEFYDEVNEIFTTVDDVILELEHSLISVSKWESKFEKPFLSSESKTTEEILFYIKTMILTNEYSESALFRLTSSNIEEINNYIESKQSATTFGDMVEKKGPIQIITSELIYYWMISLNIPLECEKWHLNRLFALIRICSIKNNNSGKKQSRNEIAQRNHMLNEQRKLKLGTTG